MPEPMCGAPARGGACTLTAGHNRGRADVPENHEHPSEPDEASAALVERLAQVINAGRLPWRGGSDGDYDRQIARAVLPIIDDLIAERNAATLGIIEREVNDAINGWRDGNRDDRRRRQGLRQALEIIASHRTDRTEERDEHEAARRAEEVRP